jgi:hypothetical protein
VEEGRLDSDKLSYDANRNVYMAKLAHLSSWNIDSLNSGAGGCLEGSVTATDASGNAVVASRTPVRVWFATRDEVVYFDTVTDSSGRYCIQPGISKGAASNTVRFFVSGTDSPDDSSMCNPLPTYCSTCFDTWVPNLCKKCGLRDDQICNDIGFGGNWDIAFNADGYAGCNPRIGCTTSSSEDQLNSCIVVSGGDRVRGYQETCPDDQRFYATLQAGSYCGGPSCYQAPPMNLGNTPVKQTGGTPPNASERVCDPANPHTKSQGQACTPGVDTCCPTDSLVCQDYVCVPKL